MGRSRRQHVGFAFFAVAWALLSAAPAVADAEPNDVISQASGPVSGATPVDGSLSTADDIDYFVFYAVGQVALRLTAADLTRPDADSCMDASVSDTRGGGVAEGHTTPQGVNFYFVRIESYAFSRCNGGMTYRFEIGPAAGVTTGPPLDRVLSPTAEPNDAPGQAGGALRPLVNYVGTHESTLDEDWFFFWVPAGTHRFELSTTAPDYGPCASTAALYASPSDSIPLEAAEAWSSVFDHITRNLTGPAQYYVLAGVDLADCVGERWQFRIESPDAVSMVNPFGGPSQSSRSPAPATSRPAGRATYSSKISLRRRGARYSGKVTSGWRGCKVRRRVTLRRSGSAKILASTSTRADGSFSFRRPSRRKGRVYVRALHKVGASTTCRISRSRTVRA